MRKDVLDYVEREDLPEGSRDLGSRLTGSPGGMAGFCHIQIPDFGLIAKLI